MKAKLIYKSGVIYQDLPDSFYSKDRVNIPKREYPAAVTMDSETTPTPEFNDYHVFQHVGFEKLGDALHKILQEI